MEKTIDSRKYLCLETTKNGFTVPELSKCPCNPEMVMAALQFLSPDLEIHLSIKDNPIDFSKLES